MLKLHIPLSPLSPPPSFPHSLPLSHTHTHTFLKRAYELLFDLKEEAWGEGGGEELRREGGQEEAEYDRDELDARLVSYTLALKHQTFAPHPEDYDLSKVARYQEFLGHVRSSAVCQVMSSNVKQISLCVSCTRCSCHLSLSIYDSWSLGVDSNCHKRS